MFIRATGQPQQYKQNPTHMIHLVDVHTILLRVESKCATCPHIMSQVTRRPRMPILMTCQKLMLPAVSCSQKYPGVVLGIFFSGSAQCMGTAMDFTLLVVEREGKILFPNCTNIAHTCQRTFFMTLHANCQSTA